MTWGKNKLGENTIVNFYVKGRTINLFHHLHSIYFYLGSYII